MLAVRQQVASLSANRLPVDVAKATTDIDAKLAAFGVVVAGRGGAPTPGAVTPFNSLNGSFTAIVSMSQVGLDAAPTQALIDTWEADCKEYNATVTAWKKMHL